MKIALGCDHGGFKLKKEIIKYLKVKILNLKILEHILKNHVIILILHYQLQKQ